MSKPSYRIDDEGNLVEEGATENGSAEQSGAAAADEATPLTPEQARRTMRALVSSEVLGVLILLTGAVYYSDYRGLLLIGAAVYAVFAIFAARYLRRAIYKVKSKRLT